MEMDWFKAGELALKVMGVIGTLLSLVFGWAWWSLRKAMVTHEQFAQYRDEHGEEHDELEGRLARGEERFARLETTLKNLPTKDEVADLRIKMERLSGDIRVATAILQRVEHPVRTMVEAALEDTK